MTDSIDQPTEPTIILELTSGDANGLLDLLHMACLHGGLRAAGPASKLAMRVMQEGEKQDEAFLAGRTG